MESKYDHPPRFWFVFFALVSARLALVVDSWASCGGGGGGAYFGSTDGTVNQQATVGTFGFGAGGSSASFIPSYGAGSIHSAAAANSGGGGGGSSIQENRKGGSGRCIVRWYE